MWIYTDIGFFSVVRTSFDTWHTLTVRARVRDDLVRLKKHLPGMGPIQRYEEADYLYRAQVSKSDLAEAMSEVLWNIDYPNFKARIAQTQPDRLLHYSKVHHATELIEGDERHVCDPRPKRSRSTAKGTGPAAKGRYRAGKS